MDHELYDDFDGSSYIYQLVLVTIIFHQNININIWLSSRYESGLILSNCGLREDLKILPIRSNNEMAMQTSSLWILYASSTYTLRERERERICRQT